MEDGILDCAPRIKKLKAKPPEMTFLRDEEREDLLARCTDKRLREMILVAVYTGSRLGELCALRWEDLNFESSVMTICRNVVLGIEGAPKGNETRHVPIASRVKYTLLRRRQATGLVFEGKDGFISKQVAWHLLNRECKKINFRHIGWHAFRHTYASHLIAQGVRATTVQKLLGHTTLRVTERYIHLAPDAFHDAIDALEMDRVARTQPLRGHSLGTKWENRPSLRRVNRQPAR